MKKINNRGITLAALVITVIILLILASVATYSGLNVVKFSKLTTFTTEMKIMQTKVNEIYQKYQDGNSIEVDGTTYYGKNKNDGELTILDIGQTLDSVSTQANKVFTGSASGITDKSGYKYWNNELVKKLGIDGVDGDFFVNIEKRSIVSYDGVTYEGKDYYTLEQVPNNLYNVEHEEQSQSVPTFEITNEEIGKETWKVTISNIQYNGYISKWEVKYQLKGETNWQTSQDLSFTVTKAGTYNVKLENGDISSEIKEILIEKESIAKPGEYTKKTEKDNYKDEDGNTATVPGGFTVSKIESEKTIRNGLVIYDIPVEKVPEIDWNAKNDDGSYKVQTEYNQFVWIPVASEESYQRDFSYPCWYGRAMDTTPANSAFTDTGYLPSDIQPIPDNATDSETAERTAVLKYNGFYIARYETGNEKEKPVSKQNATIYLNKSQTEFKTIGKDMYGDSSTYVKSAMCSGMQWDMVMKFVDKKTDGKGNTYDVRKYERTRHAEGVTEAGKNLADKVQNIYDLEGNCGEYVAEKNNTSDPFVFRGGYYNSNGSASRRTSDYGDGVADYVAFRSALYIK